MFGRKERKTPYVREPLVTLEDLRDDCIALFRDSGLSMKQVHEQGGPTPNTVARWLYGETKFPRLDSMRALFKAVGGEIMIVGPSLASRLSQNSRTNRLELSMPQDTQMSRQRRTARSIAQAARKGRTRAKA